MRFSIIIPSTRPDSLKRTLDSVKYLDYPRDEFECLVCDNTQEDYVRDIVEDYSEKYPFIVHIRAEEKASSYYARNVGAMMSRGRVLCFLDDDCLVNKDWLKMLNKRFIETSANLVKSRITHGYNNIWDRTLAGKSAFYFEKNMEQSTKSVIFRADSFAVEKEVFMELGKFEEVARGGDIVFSARFMESPYRYDYLKNPPVKHYGADGFIAFVKKAFGYGYGLSENKGKDELFGKLTVFENFKFRTFDTARYIGGKAGIAAIFLYMFSAFLGRAAQKCGILRKNPVK